MPLAAYTSAWITRIPPFPPFIFVLMFLLLQKNFEFFWLARLYKVLKAHRLLLDDAKTDNYI